MKRWWLISAALALMVLPVLAQNDDGPAAPQPADGPAKPVQLESLTDQASYIMGMGFAKRIQISNLDGADIDADIVIRAIRDTLADREQLSEDDVKELVGPIGRELQERADKARADDKQKNAGFAAEFKPIGQDKKGFGKLAGGIEYKVLVEGDGPRPAATDRVRVDYKGYLMDGTVFDSSYRRGQPAEFGLSQVIKGWTLSLQAMPVGSTWRIYIPSDLAYGDRGAGEVIGPNAPLIFEVTLFKIVGPGQ